MGAPESSGRFLLRLPPGLHEVLKEAARAAGTSLNEYCVRKLAGPGHQGVPAAARVIEHATALAGRDLAGIVVFGSWSRGEATPESDVDVLIVLAPEVPITRELYRRWDASVLHWEGCPVEPHFVRFPAATDDITGLWAEVAMDGIVVYERGFELSQRLVKLRSRIAARELERRWVKGQSYWATV